MGCVNSAVKEELPASWPKDVAASCILFKTWDESILANHVLSAEPKNEAEVELIVNWAHKEGWKVRATGIKHNWSPLTVTNQGTVIDEKTKKPTVKNLDKYVLINMMTHMNKLLGVETIDGKYAARSQTGISNSNLLKALEETKSGELTGDKDIGYGWTHGPAPDSITLGGMLTINGHGTAVPHEGEAKQIKGQAPIYGTLSNRVLSVRAIVWDEESKSYKAKEFKRNDGSALPFLTQLGRSILTEATLQVEKNYYMRCQSFLDQEWQQVFPATQDWTKPPERSAAWYLRQTGRVEIIWFPFTKYPWLHVWTVTDHNKPEGATLTETDCNYPFTDKYDDSIVDLFKAITRSDCKIDDEAIKNAEKEHPEDKPEDDHKKFVDKLKGAVDKIKDVAIDAVGVVGSPRLTPALNRALWLVLYKGFRTNGAGDIWGTSRTSMIYVRDTTLKVTANGYVIMTKEENVQEVMFQFATMYNGLLEKYAAEGKYPIANPLEIRVTGLDDTANLADGNVEGAPMTSLTYDEEAKKHGWNRAVWLDVLSMPDAKGTAEFYMEMEALVMNNPTMKPPLGRVRPEWSKGWGYTEKGPWSNESFINHTRASLPRWNDMIAALDKHDPHHLFSNDFLKDFMVAVEANGAPRKAAEPAPAAAAAPAPAVDESQYDLRTKHATIAARAPIGVAVEATKTYYWCTCGKSKNQPFCDGSHTGTEFKPLAWTATESKEVYFCTCKQTKNAPLCDGAHANLPAAAPAAAAAPAPAVDESQYDLRTKHATIAARAPIGVAVEAGKAYYWCTCGKSKNQPFCDGSHAGTEFKPLAWTATEAKEVYFCTCKQTKNAPFCDGAHANLPAEAAAPAPAPAA